MHVCVCEVGVGGWAGVADNCPHAYANNGNAKSGPYDGDDARTFKPTVYCSNSHCFGSSARASAHIMSRLHFGRNQTGHCAVERRSRHGAWDSPLLITLSHYHDKRFYTSQPSLTLRTVFGETNGRRTSTKVCSVVWAIHQTGMFALLMRF